MEYAYSLEAHKLKEYNFIFRNHKIAVYSWFYLYPYSVKDLPEWAEAFKIWHGNSTTALLVVPAYTNEIEWLPELNIGNYLNNCFVWNKAVKNIQSYHSNDYNENRARTWSMHRLNFSDDFEEKLHCLRGRIYNFFHKPTFWKNKLLKLHI